MLLHAMSQISLILWSPARSRAMELCQWTDHKPAIVPFLHEGLFSILITWATKPEGFFFFISVSLA